MRSKTILLNHAQIEQKINRIAYEIYENNADEKELVIAGIADRGYIFAQELSSRLKKIAPITVHLLELLVHSDKKGTQENKSDFAIVEGKSVVVVDDVLSSGKTLIHGVNLFLPYAAKKISTAVLVNRDHKTFPIHVNYIGLSLATTIQEHIVAEFSANSNVVYLE